MGYNATKEDARKSIEGSLKRLGVDYLDLWILRGNGPGGVRDGFEETIQAMSVRAWLSFIAMPWCSALQQLCLVSLFIVCLRTMAP